MSANRRWWRGMVSLGIISGMGCSVRPSNQSTAMPHLAHEHELRRCDPRAPNVTNPLVTELPASEKAHVESLSSERVVAVRYAGCELEVIPACRLPGSYVWRKTTPSTDTLDISDEDELFTKLPIGAIGLEGELARSGSLAVQTTVAGQMRLAEVVPTDELPAGCASATHYVEAISVGSFKLLSGSARSASGKVDVALAEAGGSHSAKRVVLREAGDPEACTRATSDAADPRCASPLQLFLQPLSEAGSAAHDRAPTPDIVVTSPDRSPGGATGVYVSFPLPDPDETWTLRGRSSEHLCTLPCGAWLETMSGAYLQRERPRAEVRLPPALPYKPGSRVRAEFNAERGAPTMSAWTFYLVGAPSLLMSGILAIMGGAERASGCDDSPDADFDDDCTFDGTFLVTGLAFYGAIGGTSLWWWLWSEESRFETYEDLGTPSQPSFQLGIGPGGLRGTF